MLWWTSSSVKEGVKPEKRGFQPMRKKLGEKFGVVFSLTVVVTDTELSASISAVGGGGNSALRKSLALSLNVDAVLLSRMISGVGSVRLGFVYRIAVKMSFPLAPSRKLFQFFDFASRMLLKKELRVALNWFLAGVERVSFHSLHLPCMISLFWSISAFHHGFDLTVVILLGTCSDTAIWIILVR